MKTFYKIRATIPWISGFIATIFTSIITISVLMAVVARYILKISIPWTEELARYLAIGLTYIGCSLALKEGKHVGVEYFIDKLSPRSTDILEIFRKVIILLFFILFTYEAWIMMLTDGFMQIAPALLIPMFWPYLSLFIGGVLMILELLFEIIEKKMRWGS